ncbi:MAG: hypothetical protein MZW92_27580 [Comamonadaceae bacterium]|nr:hypothetical protein [Comamonadaceae bacterium]
MQSICLAADEGGAAPNWILKTADAKVTAIDVKASGNNPERQKTSKSLVLWTKRWQILVNWLWEIRSKPEYYVSAASDAKKATI